MICVTELLAELCEDERVCDPDCELIDSGLLDSLAMIDLFAALADEGIALYPTRIDRNRLKTPRAIAALIAEQTDDVTV